jgi:hypothetical protein
MKTFASLVLSHLFLTSYSWAELPSGQPATHLIEAAPGMGSNSPTAPTAHVSTSVQLSGIVVAPPVRKAVIEIRTPGQEPFRYVLGEGEKAGGVQLLTIHPGNSKATVCFSGTTNQLSLLSAAVNTPAVPSQKKRTPLTANTTPFAAALIANATRSKTRYRRTPFVKTPL